MEARRRSDHQMKTLNLVTLGIIILGGINWGLVGNGNTDIVVYLFGPGTFMARVTHLLIGLSAIYQLLPLIKAIDIDEPRAEVSRHL